MPPTPPRRTAPARRRRRRLPLPAALVILVVVLEAGAILLALAPWHDAAPAAGAGTPGTTASAGSADVSPDAIDGAAEDPTEAAATPAPDAVFTIGAAGDVLPHETVIRTAATAEGYDFVPMLAATQAWSSGVDLAICSMEVPLSLPQETPSGYPLFGAPDELPANLATLGWDGCATATNHALDRGYDNSAFTLDEFDAAGLGHAGSARSALEADEPQIYELEREGQTIRVAQIAATYGTNGLPIPSDAPWVVTLIDTDRLVAQATAARTAGADLVVASLHWGVEYRSAPSTDQLEVADALAASGQIDLIIGNHPHVPQPMALLVGGPRGEGMWVAYSLGNFISNQDDLCCIPQTATGVFITATVVKPADGPARVTGLEWTPITVDRVGAQRAYPLPDLVAGDRPDGLTLTAGEISSRMAGVQAVMDNSTGAEFPERTEPSTPTGRAAVVVPRS